jgi:hypothetical protein
MYRRVREKGEYPGTSVLRVDPESSRRCSIVRAALPPLMPKSGGPLAALPMN